MALVSRNQKPFVMLKDHLLDDFSSCSSSGFNSYPRRQCCTTVRSLRRHHHRSSRKQLSQAPQPPPLMKRSRSKIQRASDAVINAVKLLPSPSVKKKLNFTRRLFKNFWRKPDPHHDHDGCDDDDREGTGEIGPWGLFREEKDKSSSDQTTVTAGSRFSTSSSNENNSWSSESDGVSESCSSGNDAVEGEKEFEKVNNRVVDVSVGGQDSPTGKKDWTNEVEKEQLSPVSVLDCPFKDEEEEEESPFQSEDTTKKVMMTKMRRFENVGQLEPVELEKRIAMAAEEEEEEESVYSLQESILISDESELFNRLNVEATALHSSEESLLIDFFRTQLDNEQERLRVAQDWIDGSAKDVYFKGEKDCRSVFVQDIEKHGNWAVFGEDRQEVGLELEEEMFASLLDETLLHLF